MIIGCILQPHASWPGLTRPSRATALPLALDGRLEGGHDGVVVLEVPVR